MKNGKRPTREQRKTLLENGYDPAAWLIVKDTPTEMLLVSRNDKAETVSVKKTENFEF